MDRLSIYRTRTLVAVEFAKAPTRLPRLAPQQHTFARIGLPEVKNIVGRLVESSNDPQFSAQVEQLTRVANVRLAYWEERIPAGLTCFVHHVRFNDDAAARAGIAEVNAKCPHFALLGLYQINPGISIFADAFPAAPAPNMWRPGELNTLTKESLFFFNFFPDQPHLIEQVCQGTIAIWAESTPGLYDTNNFVDLPKEVSAAPGIDRFVAVNLNRYRNVYGFCKAVAGGASMSVIAEDHHDDFRWYGMLTRLIEAV
jgi:hypothetical protein